ncbi:MAG TPA: hypothetical protein VJB11_03815 [archaeon]|nr:hypothetical protein [archaeon]
MMDWEECCGRDIAKDVKADKDMISSLIKTSKNKSDTEEMIKLSAITASSKITLAYDSLRELLEALALKKGYKIYNHECYAAFLKEIMDESEAGDEFDKIRKIRNAVNYYGKDITEKEAENLILKIRKLGAFVSELMKKSK